MKKLFILLIASLAVLSCERAFVTEQTNLTKNAKKSLTSKDSLHVSTQSELEVDPGVIVPPRR